MEEVEKRIITIVSLGIPDKQAFDDMREDELVDLIIDLYKEIDRKNDDIQFLAKELREIKK